ncbi:MAG: hypothetical protein HKN72_00585 [Gemmatimonadetes bacterium]|nr:hypothetical protein [Gemmatimonadota bacterium]
MDLASLKDRKVVQWAIAYCVFAFACNEGIGLVGDAIGGFSDTTEQRLALVLVFGFLPAMVMAWYHGEAGRQAFTRSEALLVGVLGLGTLVAPMILVSAPTTELADSSTEVSVEPVEPVRPAEDDLVEDRVVALPPLNVSGDGELDGLAGMGGSTIEGRLVGSGQVELFPASSLSSFDADARPGPIEVAREAGAGLVVTTEYRTEGGEVVVSAAISSGADGVLLFQLQEERAPVDDPIAAFDRTAERIVGALVAYTHYDFLSPGQQPPPTREIARLRDEAERRFIQLDYGRFIELFDSISRLAPSYVQLHRQMSAFYWNNQDTIPGALLKADSLNRYLGDHSHRLTAQEVWAYEWFSYALSGDIEAEYRHLSESQQMMENRPGYPLMFAARRANRLEEALEIHDFRYELPELQRNYLAWDGQRFMALAGLRRFDEAALAAAEARNRHPGNWGPAVWEGTALAAMGAFDALDELIDEVRIGYEKNRRYSTSVLLLEAATAARGEGYSVDARSLARRAVDETETTEDLDLRRVRAEAMGLLGEWEEAADLYAELLATEDIEPRRIEYIGAYGAAAAQAGDAGAARSALDELRGELSKWEGLVYAGATKFRMSQVHSALGEPEAALRLLRESLREGHYVDTWVHWDVHLESLRDDVRYQRLVAPR